MIINSAKCKAIKKLTTKVITIQKYQFVENLCNDLYQITPSIGKMCYIFKTKSYEKGSAGMIRLFLSL